MSTILVTVLPATLLVCALIFTAYWAGAAHEQKRTRAWARRALTAENIAMILYEGVNDANRILAMSKTSERPLDVREAEIWQRIEKELGL
jgi:uncharacterized protein (DUF486 family)